VLPPCRPSQPKTLFTPAATDEQCLANVAPTFKNRAFSLPECLVGQVSGTLTVRGRWVATTPHCTDHERI